MTKDSPAKKTGVFYGYWMIAAAFICLFIHTACGVNSFSLFVNPLQKEYGWGRGEIMASYTIYSLVLALTASLVTGKLVDHYGAGKIVAAGAAIAGIGFVLLSRMNSIWSFYLSWTVVGIGMSATGALPASTVVSNWFHKRRGTAIGLMSTGIGAGGLVLTPIIGGYIVPGFGWRMASIALALLMWSLIPLALLKIKTRPSDMGLYPDNEPHSNDAQTVINRGRDSGMTLKQALLTPTFWLIAIPFMAAGFSSVGAFQNQLPHLQDIGFPQSVAVSGLVGVSLGSLFGKFVFGWLCDRIKAKYAACIGFVLEMAAVCILVSLTPTSATTTIWLYAIVMGFGMGAWLPTLSILVSSNFGLASYGVIFSMASLAQSLGSSTGPMVVGHLYDIMHSYHQAFIILIILFAVTIPGILFINSPKLKENKLDKMTSRS